jgi:hypothetical protein
MLPTIVPRRKPRPDITDSNADISLMKGNPHPPEAMNRFFRHCDHQSVIARVIDPSIRLGNHEN